MTTTIEEVREKALFIHAYLDQGDVWYPDGKPRVQITDMDPSWRYNAANWLVRRAKTWAYSYNLGEITYLMSGCGGMYREVVSDGAGNPAAGPPADMMPMGDMANDAFEREQDERDRDPEAWIKSTALYRALVDGLPEDAAERAKHWSDCAVRTVGGECTCWERHVTECPKRDDINSECRCRDNSPEWTL